MEKINGVFCCTKISNFWDAFITSYKFKVVISALKQQPSSYIPAESLGASLQHAPSKTNASSNNSAAYAVLFLSKHTCSHSPARHLPSIPLLRLQLGAFPNPVKRGHIFPRLCPPYWARMNPMNLTDCCRTDWLWKHAPADPVPAHVDHNPFYTLLIHIYIYAIMSNFQ